MYNDPEWTDRAIGEQALSVLAEHDTDWAIKQIEYRISRVSNISGSQRQAERERWLSGALSPLHGIRSQKSADVASAFLENVGPIWCDETGQIIMPRLFDTVCAVRSQIAYSRGEPELSKAVANLDSLETADRLQSARTLLVFAETRSETVFGAVAEHACTENEPAVLLQLLRALSFFTVSHPSECLDIIKSHTSDKNLMSQIGALVIGLLGDIGTKMPDQVMASLSTIRDMCDLELSAVLSEALTLAAWRCAEAAGNTAFLEMQSVTTDDVKPEYHCFIHRARAVGLIGYAFLSAGLIVSLPVKEMFSSDFLWGYADLDPILRDYAEQLNSSPSLQQIVDELQASILTHRSHDVHPIYRQFANMQFTCTRQSLKILTELAAVSAEPLEYLDPLPDQDKMHAIKSLMMNGIKSDAIVQYLHRMGDLISSGGEITLIQETKECLALLDRKSDDLVAAINRHSDTTPDPFGLADASTLALFTDQDPDSVLSVLHSRLIQSSDLDEVVYHWYHKTRTWQSFLILLPLYRMFDKTSLTVNEAKTLCEIAEIGVRDLVESPEKHSWLHTYALLSRALHGDVAELSSETIELTASDLIARSHYQALQILLEDQPEEDETMEDWIWRVAPPRKVILFDDNIEINFSGHSHGFGPSRGTPYVLPAVRIAYLAVASQKGWRDPIAYVKDAEDVLDEIVAASGVRGVQWLADHIINGERELGAHSGWWRVFLKHISAFGLHTPDQFANSVGGIGSFLLARRPEIRQSIRDLLESSAGPKCVALLKDHLYHYDPAIRHGAAMALVACQTPVDSQALEVVARSRTHKAHSTWSEWEQFCLSIPFGPSNLAYLDSVLSTLDPLAEAFSLAALHRNGFCLDNQKYSKLVMYLQDWRNWSLDSDDAPIPAEDRAFPVLIDLITERTDDIAQKAAEKLLRFHEARLSQEVLATCLSLHLQDQWSLYGLSTAITKVTVDPSFAAAVKTASERISASGGKRPLIDLIRAAIDGSESWEGIVWQMLCDDSRMSIAREDNGQWLLDYGRENSIYSKEIGTAAANLLDDPRVRNSRWAEPRQWLALLANEFAGLSDEQIELVLQGHSAIETSVTSALIARLGHTPQGFNTRSSVGSVPAKWLVSNIDEESVDTLLDRVAGFVRPSEDLHPAICPTVDQLAMQAPLAKNELEKLSTVSEFGALVAGALSFVYNQQPSQNYILRLLGYWYRGSSAKDCWGHLVRAFRADHANLLHDEHVRALYIDTLSKALLVSKDARMASIAIQILGLNGALGAVEASYVFDNYAQSGKHYDEGLGALLTRWLSKELDEPTTAAIVESLGRGLPVLDNESWDPNAIWPTGAYPFVLYPLAFWRLTDSVNEVSIRVFSRGIKFVLTGIGPNDREKWNDLPPWTSVDKVSETIGQLEPLISSVSPAVLRRVLTDSRSSHDPVVRAICNLLASLIPVTSENER